MTKDEKLKKALDALRIIADCGVADSKMFATTMYANLTAPKMETVGVKAWECTACHTVWTSSKGYRDKPKICSYCSGDYNCNNKEFIELTGSYQRPVPEPEEEVWEGKVVDYSPIGSAVFKVPYSWIGKTVEVRLKVTE